MINLASRSSIFNGAQNLAFEISGIQNIMFEDDPDLFECEQDRLEYGEMFDLMDIKTRPVKRFYEVISFDHSDLQTFVARLSQIILQFLKELEVDKLIVISDLKSNFFGANLTHSYLPVKAAYEKLENITKTRNYDEAFIIDREDLNEMIEIAFWIGRCDASAPEFIFFSDADDRFAFHLCKAGNIHFVEFDKEIIITTILQNNQLHKHEGRCYDKFSDGRIEGRITSRK